MPICISHCLCSLLCADWGGTISPRQPLACAALLLLRLSDWPAAAHPLGIHLHVPSQPQHAVHAAHVASYLYLNCLYSDAIASATAFTSDGLMPSRTSHCLCSIPCACNAFFFFFFFFFFGGGGFRLQTTSAAFEDNGHVQNHTTWSTAILCSRHSEAQHGWAVEYTIGSWPGGTRNDKHTR